MIEADLLSTYVEQQLIDIFGEEVDALYLDQLIRVAQNPERIRHFGSQLSMVYTPLRGTGNVLIQRALFNAWDLPNLRTVKEQELPILIFQLQYS